MKSLVFVSTTLTSTFVLACLVASLNSLHVRLTHLENENSIARRRVRELEYELEQCKREVVRERTRMMESQDAIDVSARLPGPSTSCAKGEEKKSRELDQSTTKYFEIAEEKKGSILYSCRYYGGTERLSALEAFITLLVSLISPLSNYSKTFTAFKNQMLCHYLRKQMKSINSEKK